LLGRKMQMEEQVQVASKESDEIQMHLEKMTTLFSSLQKEEERSAVQFIIHGPSEHLFSHATFILARSLKLEMSGLEVKSTKLLGDCLLVAAFVSYGGPLSPLGDRQSLIDGWMRSLQSHNIPFSNYFNPHEFLSTQALTE
jgi:hypothetical protein